MKKRLVLMLLLMSNLSFGQVTDATKHVYAGMGVTIISGVVAKKLIKKPIPSTLVGIACGSLAGYLKETVYDRRWGRGVYDVNDMTSTIWGSLVGGVILRVSFDINEKRKNKNDEYYRKLDE